MTDPRSHHHVVSADGDRIRYVCGCLNEIVPTSGVLRCVSKCRAHGKAQRDPSRLRRAYYEELGVLDGDIPRPGGHEEQLAEALGNFPVPVPGSWAIEVGCGVSPYVEGLLAAGYAYLGVDPSPWVAGWMKRRYGVPVAVGTLEEFTSPIACSLVLAPHVLEHTPDAPTAIVRCAEMLLPGGELWAVVPDDSDPLNPDHTHVFTPESLQWCIVAAGLVVLGLEVRRHVPQENFLYVRARKS